MPKVFNKRRETRPTLLVASALAAVGVFTAPTVSIFADAPPKEPSSVQTAPDAAKSETSSRPQTDAAPPRVVVESLVLQETIKPELSGSRPARVSAEEARQFEALVNLYAYAYPLVLSNEIKRETTSRFFLATANETFYFPKLPDARYRATEFPNVDSIFAAAWLDLAREAQIVVVPAHTNVPYSLEIVDGWSNVVASFDEKTLADAPTVTIDGRSVRAFALVGPKTPKPTNLPPEIRVVESPSSLALTLARVFVENSKRNGAFGTRPAVQTLYDFATVPITTFTSELDASQDAATPRSAPAHTEPSTDAPKETDATPQTNDAKRKEEVDLNQDLTPPQTNAFDELKRYYVAQNAVRYAALKFEDEKSKNDETAPTVDAPEENSPKPSNDDALLNKDNAKQDETTASESRQSTDDAKSQSASERAEDSNAVQSSSENANDVTSQSRQPTLAEKTDDAIEEGQKNYERERAEERSDVDNFWRETQERSREATRAVGSAYDDVKRWFHNQFERDEHFWRDFNDAMKRDAQRDLRRFERLVDTPRPTRPWFDGPIERVARMSPEKYWSTFVELLKTNPPIDANEKILNSMQTLGLEAGKPRKLAGSLRKLSGAAFGIARKKIEIAAQTEMLRNTTPTNWIVFQNLGDYGDDYFFRAGAANVFIGANIDKNALYPFAILDASGEPLDGSASYVLRFPAGQEPPTDFLWSLTLYDGDGYLARNQWNKYGVKSDEGLKRAADGSLEILIQHEKPQGDTTNWIPAPRGPFVLALRVYRPHENPINAPWTPPAIQKIQRETTAQ